MPPTHLKPHNCAVRCLIFSILIGIAMTSTGGIEFADVTEEAGIDFHHQSGAEGKRWTVEITGPGVGVLDYDLDGLMDIWAIQGGPLKDRMGDLPSDRLYRNVSVNGKLKFVDVTEQMGLSATEYGMGIVTGDILGNGNTDVILLNFGPNQLFQRYSGKFREVKDSAISNRSDWSISGSLADLNGDNFLDLYVANYMEFPSLDKYKACRRLSMRRGYCAPSNFEPTPDQLFLGQGREFVDVTEESGIASKTERGMGVVVDDFDRDNRPDIYVANDMAMNFLWLNRSEMGYFRAAFDEVALPTGVAVNGHGMREASMGVAVGDWDRDFDPDLFITHDTKESNTLYSSEFKGWFSDQTVKTGLASTSLSKTGFGVVFSDFENDGDLDIFIANGSVSMIDSQIAAKIEPPLRQKNQIYENDTGRRFTEVVDISILSQEEVSRGVAVGDLDNDGLPDLVVSNNGGPMRVYHNRSTNDHGKKNNWIGVQVYSGYRDAIGAQVWIEGDNTERKVVRTDGSYGSASDPRVLFGLGETREPQTVVVRWMNGDVKKFEALEINRYHKLRRGPID